MASRMNEFSRPIVCVCVENRFQAGVTTCWRDRETSHRLLEEFSSLGIDFVSLNESIDTSTPMGKMIFTVIGAVAELERSLIRERVMMGLDRSKRQGKRLGRPRRLLDRHRVDALRGGGLSLQQIATMLDLSKDTVARVCKP